MRAPPSSPVRQQEEAEGGAAGEVGTTGPTTAAAAAPVETEEREQQEQARKQGEAAALELLLAPDESGIVASSVQAGELFTRGACAWAVGAAILATYWATLPPGLAAADHTGEFVAAACGLEASPIDGQRHPALALLLATVAVRLVPRESPAWCANMLSALCMAVAAVLLFLSVDIMGRASARRRAFFRQGVVGGGTEGAARAMAAAAAAALFFGWSPRAWEYAMKPDSVAVDTMLVALALFATLRVASAWDWGARKAWARAGACIAALALCNQPSMAAARVALLVHGPMLVSSIAGVARDVPVSRALLDLEAVFGLCLLPGVFTPLAFMLGKGQPGLPRTQGTAAAFESWTSGAVHRLAGFAAEMALHQGLYGVGPLLELLGVAVCLHWGVGRFLLPARYLGDAATVQAALNRHIHTALRQLPDAHGRRQREEMDQREKDARQASARVVWAILCASTLSFVAAAVAQQQRDVDVVIGHMLGCFCAGVGMDWALQQLVVVPTVRAAQAHNATRRGLRYLGACVLCAGLPLLQLLRTLKGESVGGGGLDLWRRYSHSIMEPLPRKSVLLVLGGGMQSSALRYHQACQGLRPDVKVLPFSTQDGARSLVDAWMDRAPGGVYLAGCTGAVDQGADIMTMPFGLTMRFLWREAPEAEQQQWYESNKRAWRTVLHEGALPLTALPPSLPARGKALITRDVFEHQAEFASHLLDDVVHTGRSDFARLAEAVWWLELVAALDPGRAARVNGNLGLAYSHMLGLQSPPAASQTLLRLGGGGEYNDLLRDVARNVTSWYDPWQPGADDWRTWAGERLLETWRGYLDRTDAAGEPGFEKIRYLYEVLLLAESGSAKGWGDGK